jgi:hypothetical protein
MGWFTKFTTKSGQSVCDFAELLHDVFFDGLIIFLVQDISLGVKNPCFNSLVFVSDMSDNDVFSPSQSFFSW